MARWPLRRVTVTGESMQPTLRDRDQVLVWVHGRVRPGDIVVARLPGGRPLGVKRAVRREGAGWVLEGDAGSVASTDSRTFGPVAEAEVLGRVVVRYWPPRRSA
ncbi:MAG: S24/S26 family peptidase [Mycobacteriales bacterium]